MGIPLLILIVIVILILGEEIMIKITIKIMIKIRSGNSMVSGQDWLSLSHENMATPEESSELTWPLICFTTG